MLRLSQTLLNQPIVSIQTGGQIATATAPIINPNNLKIEGWYCQDRFSKSQLILQTSEIRDIIQEGIVVNDSEALAQPKDLVRLKKVLDINFELIGKPVVTVSKDRIGKVSDYAVDASSLYIQKFYVAQSLLKSFAGGSLSVDRTQIVEITNHKVVIQDLLQATPAEVPAAIPAV